METYNPPPTPKPKPTPKPPYKLECVIVCANYTDFLSETLPHNKQLFDRLVVVTAKEDKATRKLCEFYHVECIPTHVLETLDDKFCKGAAIDLGLNRLSKDGWVLHLDADMWLPPQTRILLQAAELDPAMLYGIDRFNVIGFEHWRRFLGRPVLQHENKSWVHLGAFPMGTRVMAAEGYVPIGFFQLWNPKVSGISNYMSGHTTAGREDYNFARQWPRAKRALLPEIVGYHLESEKAVMGANWDGRKTRVFGFAHE